MDAEKYRESLIIKLNALNAVLMVAIRKIEKSMEEPGVNIERLTKIRANLLNTLETCKRAQDALIRKGSKPPATATSGARAYTELSNIDEYRKFQDMPPISAEEIAGVDLMDLCDKLQEE